MEENIIIVLLIYLMTKEWNVNTLWTSSVPFIWICQRDRRGNSQLSSLEKHIKLLLNTTNFILFYMSNCQLPNGGNIEFEMKQFPYMPNKVWNFIGKKVLHTIISSVKEYGFPPPPPPHVSESIRVDQESCRGFPAVPGKNEHLFE